jgi:sulfite reductase beta subunit-like hemoprotein
LTYNVSGPFVNPTHLFFQIGGADAGGPGSNDPTGGKIFAQDPAKYPGPSTNPPTYFGDGDLRLTVWQNLLISGVPTESLAAAREQIERLGLAVEANAIRSGLVACTGNTGCKFAASDTKRHAEEIARWCEMRVSTRRSTSI